MAKKKKIAPSKENTLASSKKKTTKPLKKRPKKIITGRALEKIYNKGIKTHEFILDACQEDKKAILPVYVVKNKEIIQNRTGFLLAIGEQGFLITAAHELLKLNKAGYLVYVTSPRRGQGGILIDGDIFGTEENYIDVAILKMTAATKDALDKAGARFLRTLDIDCNASADDGVYLVRGYPLELKANPMSLTTSLFEGDPPVFEYPYDKRFHLALEHTSFVYGRKNSSAKSPKIAGMSGGGIWKIAKTISEFTTGKCNVANRRLVAIQTDCTYGTYLKGTWIKWALKVIFDNCPETHNALKLIFPSK